MGSIAANGREWPGYPAATLGNIIRQWSPPRAPGEKGNNTEGMIGDIMKRTGLDRTAKWDSLTAEQKDAFVRAYAWREGYHGAQLP